MKVLSIDTSTKCLSMAVLEESGTICELSRITPMQHSSLLFPMMDDCLKKAGITIKAIDGFAVSLGPGSFTGLRIGVAAMKGLAFSLGRPIVGIPTLDVIAENAKPDKYKVVPILDAKRGQVYSAIYTFNGQHIKRLSEDMVIDIDGLLEKIDDKVMFLGEGLERYQDVIKEKSNGMALFAPRKSWFPRASVVARHGIRRLKSGPPDSTYDISPIYHRRPEAEEKIKLAKVKHAHSKKTR